MNVRPDVLQPAPLLPGRSRQEGSCALRAMPFLGWLLSVDRVELRRHSMATTGESSSRVLRPDRSAPGAHATTERRDVLESWISSRGKLAGQVGRWASYGSPPEPEGAT